MSKLRTLIIDDEELARARFAKLLEPYLDQIEIIGEVSDGLSAVKEIDAQKPDLIFIDIQMPGHTGFEVLKHITHRPMVVFVTAYDQYAMQAFEENSVDYLLKPVEAQRLKETIEKLPRVQDQVPQHSEELFNKIQHLINSPKQLKRLHVKIGDRTILLEGSEIYYFESEDKYTNVYSVEGKHIIDTPLVDLEHYFEDENFLRIHRGTLVNSRWIRELIRLSGGKMQVKLKNEDKSLLSVSRNYTDRVKGL